MIEIAFDKNEDNKFLNKDRPIVEISNDNLQSFSDYRILADKVHQQYAKEQIILVKINSNLFSANLFAVALFVSSCLKPTQTECVVFKVKDYEKALQSYKPYVALTIALKYAIRLFNQSVIVSYKEIANMTYLGIDIYKNYAEKSILMCINNNQKGVDYICKNIDDAIIAAATLKAFALMKVDKKYTAKIYQSDENCKLNIENIINKIVKNVSIEL